MQNCPRQQLGWLFCLTVVAMGHAPQAATAVVVGTTLGNTTAPADDPGWANVGILKTASAVYLGDRWVLTAGHVGGGAVTFPGIGTFASASGTAIQLSNPDPTLTKPADLLLFQLTQDPGLPPIQLSSVTPSVGDEVLVIGNGVNRADEQTQWNVSQRGAVWTWSETSGTGDYQGFKTTGTPTKRWGTNLVEDDETFFNEFDPDITTTLEQTTSDTVTFITEFDLDGSQSDDTVTTVGGSTATAYESQAVVLDSGGAVFVKRDDQWLLAGITLAVEGHRNQPDATTTAIYGDTTYYADLATYLSQIQTKTLYGDFNGDLELTVDDLDTLGRAISLSLDDPRFDLDRDGKLTSTDYGQWVKNVYRTYVGDSNLDGEFNSADLILVLQGGQYEDNIEGNSNWATGDWDGDREFTTRDLVAALSDGGYDQGPHSGFAAETSLRIGRAVPEPSGICLMLIGVGALGCRRRRGCSD
ncbi:MAG: trypsin-like serine protease [Planctomycetales bacterium]|nr:trypsin-like serine protease [Planctomycetales bacterium]MCA9169680.1 trypsin-like serine protease [Planctomycetales bacterium]